MQQRNCKASILAWDIGYVHLHRQINHKINRHCWGRSPSLSQLPGLSIFEPIRKTTLTKLLPLNLTQIDESRPAGSMPATIGDIRPTKGSILPVGTKPTRIYMPPMAHYAEQCSAYNQLYISCAADYISRWWGTTPWRHHLADSDYIGLCWLAEHRMWLSCNSDRQHQDYVTQTSYSGRLAMQHDRIPRIH